MITQIRHRWETVALTNGATLCATHGSLVCGDGEHRYDVTSYRCEGKVFTTLMVYNCDGTCPSSLAHEFVTERPWGNADTEAALTRFCESRDGGIRRDGSVRDDWGGFVRFVEEKTDDRGNDIYGSPVVTAMRWIPFDMASHTVRAAEAGEMDMVGLTGGDGVADTKAEERIGTGNEIPEAGTNGWEIWPAQPSMEIHGHKVPSLTVYGGRRYADRDKALALWEDCGNSCLGMPKMLVRTSGDKLAQIGDLGAFTVSVGTGAAGYGGRL